MGVLKTTSGVLAVLAVLLLVLGVGGFSSVAAERGFNVAVVSDEEAFVGYEAENLSIESDSRVTLVTVTNRISNDLSVDEVTISGADGLEITDISKPTSIVPGESGDIEASVSCEESVTTNVEVTVTATGQGFFARVFGETRSFDITCTPADSGNGASGSGGYGFGDGYSPDSPNETKVGFNGQGNAIVYHESDSVSVWVWGYDASNSSLSQGEDLDQLDNTEIDTGEPVRDQLTGADGARIVAIAFKDEGITYVHPEYDIDSNRYDSGPSAGWGVLVNGTSPSTWP